MTGSSPNALRAFIGLVWCIVVIVSYYAGNIGYYQEKIGVFGKFLLQFIGF